MYDYLIGLDFIGAVKELESREVEFDFGQSSYEEIVELMQQCQAKPEEFSFEETYIYIGGYWNDLRFDVYFDDDCKVANIFEFEGWD